MTEKIKILLKGVTEMKYTDYVDKELSVYADSKNLYLFKKQLLAEMAERANEIIATGIDDEKVLNDLVISEYGDIDKRYTKFVKDKKDKKKNILNSKIIIVGILGFVLALTTLYLCVSFATNAWSKTWLIMLFGVVAGVVGATVVISKKMEKKLGKFNLVQRLLSVADVFLVAVLVFLTLKIVFLVEKAWLMLVAAVVVALVADVVMAFRAKEKTAVLNVLIYIPVIATILYVLAALIGVIGWHPGWLMVVISVMIDIVIIMVKLMKTPAEEDEADTEDDEWSED